MNTDVELDRWRERWRAETESDGVSDRKIQATRPARRRTVVPWLASAALLGAGVFIANAAASTAPIVALVAGTAWGLLVMVTVFSGWQFWSERTLAGEAAAVFLTRAIDWRLSAILASACAAFLLIALWLPWTVAFALQPPGASTAGSMTLVALVLPAFALIVAVWRSLKWRSELTYFREIEGVALDEMAAQDEPSPSEHEVGRMRPSRWHRRTRKSEVQR
jgi:hypothetical protein